MTPELTQILQDALGQHTTTGYVLAAVVALCILVPLVLKAMGKNIPFLDTLVNVIVMVLRGAVKKPEPEVPVEPPKGVGNVVELKDWPPEDKK